MDNNKATILKGKCHIVDKKYKVNGFMKSVNQKLQIEVGAGNNQFDTNINDETTYIKLINKGDLDIKVRLSKDGKESRFIPLSPVDKHNGITIFFTGKEAAAYLREAHEYVDYMINGFYELPRLKDPDYTNDEQRFSENENGEIVDRFEK